MNIGHNHQEILISQFSFLISIQTNFSRIDFQDSHFFQVHLNGALKVDEQNLNPQRFENVQVFASANFYWAADALLKNLHLNTNPDGKYF